LHQPTFITHVVSTPQSPPVVLVLPFVSLPPLPPPITITTTMPRELCRFDYMLKLVHQHMVQLDKLRKAAALDSDMEG
jgi:hypothetical protein